MMLKKALALFAGTVLTILVVSGSSSAQAKQRVRFARGSDSATVKGVITGYAYRDYVVGAAEGQSLELKLATTGSSGVFTVFTPTGDNLEGAAEMDEFTAVLPNKGDYVIRVLMMRAVARRKNSRCDYSLKITIR